MLLFQYSLFEKSRQKKDGHFFNLKIKLDQESDF
jgi:hypothetical protein